MKHPLLLLTGLLLLAAGTLSTHAVTLVSNNTFDDWTQGNTVSVNCSGLNAPFIDLSTDIVSSFAQPADLIGANLDGASLDNASLDNASLIDASLDGAFLYNASLDNAILDFASLNFAFLIGAILDNASLDNASLIGASLDFASFLGTDLSNAVGLDTTEFGVAPTYDLSTNFTGTGFDPVAAGWTLVPEPSRALLSLLALGAVLVRRRR